MESQKLQQKDKQHFQNVWVSQLLGFLPDHYHSWVNIPRYINDLRDKKIINDRERNLYVGLRSKACEYGYVITNIEYIRKHIFYGEVTKDSINSYLRTLKNRRLVWYADRNGAAGDFEVHFDDFFLPDEKKTNLLNRFSGSQPVGTPAGNAEGDVTRSQEGDKEVKPQFRRLETHAEAVLNTSNGGDKEQSSVGTNTDNNTNTQTDTLTFDSSMSYKKDKGEEKTYIPKLSTESFDPEQYARTYNKNPYEISELKKIAQYVHDPYMDFLLSRYEKIGFWVIQNAYTQFLEDEKNPKVSITAPAKYFNAKIAKLYMETQQRKIGNMM